MWCFDEVQCDIEEVTSRSARSTSLDSFPKISTLSAMICSLFLMGPRSASVLAGTALNLERVEAAVKAGIQDSTDGVIPPESRKLYEPRTRTLDRCHLMSSNDLGSLLDPTFRSLLEAIWDATSPALPGYDLQHVCRTFGASLLGNQGILEDAPFLDQVHQHRQNNVLGPQKQDALAQTIAHFGPEQLWKEIEHHSIPLLGRYRWAVCYIEELFRSLILHGSLTEVQIRNASVAVQKAAKGPLKRRIRELATSANPQRRQLAIDVYHMAIQFELYGRSRILNTAAAAILIEQGLGYVQEVQMAGLRSVLSNGSSLTQP